MAGDSCITQKYAHEVGIMADICTVVDVVVHDE